MSADGLRAAEQKMRDAGQPEEAIASFASAYERLEGGDQGFIESAELEFAGEMPALEELPAEGVRDALARLVVIKLNGGLATTMGLRGPKSLMEARDGRSFLDFIIGQTLALRRAHDIRLPLVLMNSDVTRDATREALAEHPELDVGLPLDFEQSMVPKLVEDTRQPVTWPAAPALEWCPPGHGDIYGALRRSGLLRALLDRGFRYAMISNSDNLGASVEPRIAAHLERERIPFLMEVVVGTEADRKGGHVARRREDGQLILREIAQTPPDDEESFRDYRRWRYYNTNNLWVNLEALADLLEARNGVLALPLIVNRKTVDPRDPGSTNVLQLESAMGAAIGSFPGAELLVVPRSRFVPVKTTNDLLVMRSDIYSVSEDMEVHPLPERDGRLPFVDLDSRFYKLLDQFERHFPEGAPSLRDAERLVVRGDVTFGAGIVVRGEVQLESDEPLELAPGTTLDP
jgi:UTP--glucose-1-phosphate uridylyltransferase